ncbi:VTT domain-containing protein [Alteromonas ponticola]|uniref:VTT domain-containing protein n=1 Tax=Alteromonas aquimaris TaxID=2998417 RepID=A0ABT3P835_9ALTE|nr:VTT domain-containing protein [Alteromonas aquimaris]MCW8108927.1 VTT domain-containing protein [Alteromonas aquimaris]
MSIKGAIKQKTHNLVHSNHMLTSITVASFLESTIIPIPLEAILVPLMQARRERLWMIALMATIGCIIGAVFGYALGFFLFDMVGEWVIQTFSTPEQFDGIKQKMQREGFWFVMTLGIAPIPFQIAMLAAGATHYSILSFLLATLIARSIRYFGLAAAVYYGGNKAEKLIRQYKTKAIIALTLIIVLLWWVTTQL